MLKKIACLHILFATLLSTITIAATPANLMGPHTLGIDYDFTMLGQNLYTSATPSHEYAHTLNFHYAPVEYSLFSVGLGLNKLYVESMQKKSFEGSYEFCPSFGLDLYSPRFLNEVLKVSAGGHFLYLNNSNRANFSYAGSLLNPYLGIVIAANSILDIELGARGNMFYGTMDSSGFNEKEVTNSQLFRGYFSLTLKSPQEGTYLIFDFDMSPDTKPNWNRGPVESKISFAIGFLIGNEGLQKKEPESKIYFPAYNDMKEREKQMAEEN